MGNRFGKYPNLTFGEFYILQIARNYDAITALSDKMDNTNVNFCNKVRCTMAFEEVMLTKRFGCPLVLSTSAANGRQSLPL